MRRKRGSIMVVVAGLLAGLMAVPASAAGGAPPGLPVQLSLGDSWGAGVGAPVGQGYVEQLYRELQQRLDCLPAASPRARSGCRQLQLENLSVGGATTPSLIASQLPAAVALLESRNGDDNPRNDVALVTLHIGGNDVTNPIIGACLGGITPLCLATVEREFGDFRSDLDLTLSSLRSAAGPDTPIVIGTYDNPIATCELGEVPGAVALGAIVLEGSSAVTGAPVEDGLHDIIREVAADHDVRVAEVFGQLAADDWVGGSDCLHPDESGYEVVTDAFLHALQLS